MSASTLSGNSASADVNGGGAIYNAGTVQIANSTLSGNSASGRGRAGGGILNRAMLTVSNSTLSGNSAQYGGGAILNDGAPSGKATLTVKASTFSGNSAQYGGGIENFADGGSESVELGSTILNAGALGRNIYSGTVISDGYNLTSDDGGGFLTGIADQINIDPMLGPLQDNGGPTFTHALLPGSPAIDQGYSFGLTTDQRGFPRTLDRPCIANASGGDGTDIGAFEAQQPCPVAVSLSNVGVVSGQFGFDIAGGSNQVVVVEASTNLVSWTALATNTLGAGPLHFNDLIWTNFQQRFYRARLNLSHESTAGTYW